MQKALELAVSSSCPQRHGAVVYKAGRLLGLGVNVYKNTPTDFLPVEGVSIHAEIAAISRVSPENLKGATVYVARAGRCAPHALSQPCPRCYEALKKAGVKRIIYTD